MAIPPRSVELHLDDRLWAVGGGHGSASRDRAGRSIDILVRPGAEEIPDDEDEDEVGSVGEVLVWDGASFAEDDPGKYEGERRLRLHVAVVPGTRRARFRYYFEVFGEVELPASSSHGAGA